MDAIRTVWTATVRTVWTVGVALVLNKFIPSAAFAICVVMWLDRLFPAPPPTAPPPPQRRGPSQRRASSPRRGPPPPARRNRNEDWLQRLTRKIKNRVPKVWTWDTVIILAILFRQGYEFYIAYYNDTLNSTDCQGGRQLSALWIPVLVALAWVLTLRNVSENVALWLQSPNALSFCAMAVFCFFQYGVYACYGPTANYKGCPAAAMVRNLPTTPPFDYAIFGYNIMGILFDRNYFVPFGFLRAIDELVLPEWAIPFRLKLAV